MKAKLIIWLLAILPLFVSAQTKNATFDVSDLATKVDVFTLNKRIDSLVSAQKGTVITTPVTVIPDCGRGPALGEIRNVTKTFVQFQFDGDGVPTIKWTIRSELGVNLRTGVTPKLTENWVGLTFEALPVGKYTLTIEGAACKSKSASSKDFTITDNTGVVIPSIDENPVTIVSDRKIIMNTTGFGFDVNDATGINKDWRERIEAFRDLSYNGEKFSGINGVCICVRWYDYEPTEGSFRDDKLVDAIQWCQARNLQFNVFFWGLRKSGDGFLPRSEMAHAGGVLDKWGNRVDSLFIIENDKYTFATHSELALTKLQASIAHLTTVMRKYGATGVVRSGYGETEEVAMPMMKSFKWISPTETQINTIGLSGYAPVDRAAWKRYLVLKGLPDAPAPLSPDPGNAWTTGDYWNSSPYGRAWYDFLSDGLTAVQKAFREGARTGGIASCGVYADAGSAQSAWLGTYHLDRIFSGNDYVYSSDGGTIYDIDRKLFAIDVNRGTFPNSKVAFEFDPQDISAEGNDRYGTPINSELFKKYAASGLERGADLIFLSMAFSRGENGNHNNIADITPGLYYIQKNYIQKKEIKAIPQGTPFVWPITSLSGTQGSYDTWKYAGGGLDKQIKVKIQ